MAQSLAVREDTNVLEQVVIQGDLKDLTPQQRVTYYRQVCESLGLNHLTRPFEYIFLNNKLTLYERRNCTDQLRKIHGVNITKLERDFVGDIYAVTAYATDAHGRSDSSIGAVPIAGLKGEALANALMKAETKSKRRVTLSLCGLSWPDETEVESIPEARTVVVDSHTGEILDERPSAPQITRDDDKMWKRWLALRDEALSLGVVVPNLSLPIDRPRLQGAGMEIRGAVNQKKAQLASEERARQGAERPSPKSSAQSSRASEEVPASGARDSDMVDDKNDTRWQDWLATERDARAAGLEIDTSGVHLPIAAEALLSSITDLKEAIHDAKDGKQEEEAF